MALPASPGATAIGTFNAVQTKREDISEILLASMALENTVAGLLPVGEPFADPDACRWEEDALNIFEYTDGTVGGQNATDITSTLQLTAGQGDSLMVGTLLIDTGQVLQTNLELLQVQNIVNDTVTVRRAYAGSTAVTHAQSAVYRNIGAMLPETSDLDKDISRNRVANLNRLGRYGLNVQISDEQLQRAMAQYVPGVPNEFDYQVAQRTREIKRMINNAFIYSRISTASGDFSSFDGILRWLQAQAQDQASVVFSPDMVNTAYSNVFAQGGDPDWLVCGTTIVRRIANLYSDRIRIEQAERSRGWSVIYFDTDLGKTLRLILDAYWPAQSFAVLDSRRIRVRPFLNSFFYSRTAETMRDGEAARLVAKMSLEVRNTDTVANSQAGFAHQLFVRAA